MTGTGETTDSQKQYTFSARLKRPGLAIDKVYAADAEGKPTPHPSLAGISLTRRRCGLLQAAAQAFETMGVLSEHRVQITSDKLSKVALDLLTSDPTENVKLWAGRLLLTRLDDGGTRFLAGADAMKQVLEHATTAQSYCSRTVQAVQGALASVLLSKVAKLGSSEAALLRGYVGEIMQILRSGSKLNAPQAIQILECVCNSCHSVDLCTEMQREENVTYLWAVVEATQKDHLKLGVAARLTALQILAHTLLPTTDNLDRLLVSDEMLA